MEAGIIKEKSIWDGFVASQERSQFLQSFAWGNFKKGIGLKIFRLAVLKEGKIILAGQIIKTDLVLGNNYLYLPRGPVYPENLNSGEKKEAIEKYFEEAQKIAEEENAIFLKVEPVFMEKYIFADEKKGFKESATIQPPDTVLVELDKSEEEILAKMHPKTRYNIRLAERKGVRVEFSEEPKEIDDFFKLAQVVNEREKISCFSKSYYQKMFEEYKKDGQAFFAKGIYEGKTIVVNLIIKFGDTVVYNHGASANEFRNVMAPHLVQWETIKKAKKEGYKYYDFRGIAPCDDPAHKWAGITRFKKGFSSHIITYPGAYDFIFKPLLYQLYLLGKKIK